MVSAAAAAAAAAMTTSATTSGGGSASRHLPPTTTGPAALIVENARIWSDGLPSFAEFLAVDASGRFIAVGDHDDRLIGPATRRIDAHGKTVIPGLIDAHLHMLGGGQGLSQLQLREATSRADFINRIGTYAKSLPSGRWILGGRWSTESWPVEDQPHKEWIDPVTDDHPAYLPRMDGHSALVNSAALRIAGITNASPDNPPGGVIDRDPQTGEPTGILRETAMTIVSQHIPAMTIDDEVAALRQAMKEAVTHGITAVGDIPMLADMDTYARLAESSEPLLMRLYLYPTATDWAAAVPIIRKFPTRPGWIEVRGLKTYIDGSLGSRTAFMREPFLGNEPGRESWRGLLREGIAEGGLARNLAAAREAGLQPIAHAIGDEGNHFLLETLASVYGPDLQSARARSEHTQHLLPEDIARFGSLGVIASMQPFHKADDGRYAESYIGEARCRSSYAYKSLLDSGATLAFGSDWPVVPINPFLGIESAVTGRTLDGHPWQTQENITVGEALRSFTSRAAFALEAENEIGRIAPGMRADFVILDRSPFDASPEWSKIKPVAVYVEGKLVYESK